MRTRRVHWAMRGTALMTAFTMAGMAVLTAPCQAQKIKEYREATMPKPHSQLPPGFKDKLTPAEWARVDKKRAEEAARNKKDVRVLSLKEMKAVHGRGYRNQYLVGTLPWHRSLRDVNLCTGNLFKSFTDIQVQPAKGAGLALQRTYNSNESRVGPFGIGWTHAYDIHMEEAQGAGSKDYDYTSTAADLNFTNRKDFFGHPMHYHRDADGLYSPPPFLYDELDSNYNAFLANGPVSVMDDTQVTEDGSKKHFVSNGSPERVCDWMDDKFGNRTHLTYNQITVNSTVMNQLQTVTDPSGRSLTFTWTNLGTAQTPAWRITAVQGPTYSVTYEYDTNLNLWKSHLDPTGLNRTMTYGYTSFSDGNGNTETGLLSSITDPLGHTIVYTYNVLSPPLQQIAFYTGTVWVTGINESAGVDANNAPRTHNWVIYNSGSLPGSGGGTDFRSDEGLIGAVSFDALLRSTQFEYDRAYDAAVGAGYDSANNTTENWDTLNLVSSDPSEKSRNHRYTYGPHGNVLTHTQDGFSGTETTTYYGASKYFQKQSVTDMNAHTSTFDYGTKDDANQGNRGNVLWVRDSGYADSNSPSYQKQFTYTYNQYGQKTSETNLNGVVIQYTYGDQWGNLTQVVQDPHVTQGDSHLNRTTSMQYNIAGSVTQSADPKGQTSTFAYNTLGQPMEAGFPGENISYGYGANGRTESVTDNRGTTSIAYEAGCDRVSSVTDPVTGTISYTYLPTGERATMTLPGGGTWTYSYVADPYSGGLMLGKENDLNTVSRRLSRITDDQGRAVDYYMNGFGMPLYVKSNQVFGSGNVLQSYCRTDYIYDNENHDISTAGIYSHGWLVRLKNTWNSQGTSGSQSSIICQYDYMYDTAGQRLTNQVSDNTGPIRTETYGYDKLNRLTSVNYGDGQTQSYTFDAMGNRLSKTDAGGGINGTESYSYNNANMLLSRAGNAYTNDANGNTLTGGGRTCTWDSQNRMATCSYNGNTSSFVYGADGIRHQSTVNGTTTDFVLDNSMFIREMRGGSVYATYLMGARGPEYRRDASGNVKWYLYDGLGSVTGEVDPTGAVTAQRKYDVYGAARGTVGTSTTKHGFVGRLGHPSEDETGLIYMRARYMDPATGRFVSEDPSLNGANWFVYACDNPVNTIDPSGKSGIFVQLLEKLGWETLKNMIYSAIDPGNALGLGTQGVDPLDAARDTIVDLIKSKNTDLKGMAAKFKRKQGENHAEDGLDYAEEAIAGKNIIDKTKQIASCIEDLEIISYLQGTEGDGMD